MSTAQKKRLIKAEGPTARRIYAAENNFVYYFEMSAGSVHISTDIDLGEVTLATKLLKWLH